MNTTLSPAATYVDAVHAALADLPADDLADIIEDVRDHVEQVLAELGEDATTGALEERLGKPADYAAELRSAAGYPPALTNAAAPGRPARSVRWLATWSVRVAFVLTTVALLDLFFTGFADSTVALAILSWFVTAFFLVLWWVAGRRGNGENRELPDMRWLRSQLPRWRQHPFGAAVVETVPALRPAWWMLRAWVAIELIGIFFGTGLFPLPRFPGAPVLLVAAIIVSVWLGRRAASHRQSSVESALVLVGNVAAVLILLWMSTTSVLSQASDQFLPDEESAPFIYQGAIRSDGTPITNLYPYGPDGKLLVDVRLYDQDGRPFDVLAYEGCKVDEMTGEPELPALNVFPRPTSSYREFLEPDCIDRGIVPPFGSTLPGTSPDVTPAPSANVVPQPIPEGARR